MSAPVFLTAFFLASGVLALWLDFRLGERGPSSLRSLILFAAAGLVGLRVAKAVAAALIDPEQPAVTMAVLFGVLLPALVYVFLTTIWVLKIVRGAMLR